LCQRVRQTLGDFAHELRSKRAVTERAEQQNAIGNTDAMQQHFQHQAGRRFETSRYGQCALAALKQSRSTMRRTKRASIATTTTVTTGLFP
jgi:hypothetical protein